MLMAIESYTQNSSPTCSVQAVASAVGDDAHRMTIGLKPMRESQWIEVLDDQQFQLQEKRRVIRAHPDTLASTEAGRAGIDELLELLIDHLCRHFPRDYRRIDSANCGLGIVVNALSETLVARSIDPARAPRAFGPGRLLPHARKPAR